MKYSIIIPTFNRSEKLKKCLTSIRESGFDNKLGEIIIVENGSSVSRKIAKEFSTRYFKIQEANTSKARNHGAKRSRFENLIFIDDDYKVEKSFIPFLKKNQNKNKIINILVNHPSKNIFSLSYKGIYEFHIKNQIFGKGIKTFFRKIPLEIERENIQIPLSCTIIKKRTFLRYKFDEEKKELEDLDFYKRVSKNNKIKIINKKGVNHFPTENEEKYFGREKIKLEEDKDRDFLGKLGRVYDLIGATINILIEDKTFKVTLIYLKTYYSK